MTIEDAKKTTQLCRMMDFYEWKKVKSMMEQAIYSGNSRKVSAKDKTVIPCHYYMYFDAFIDIFINYDLEEWESTAKYIDKEFNRKAGYVKSNYFQCNALLYEIKLCNWERKHHLG